MNLKDNYIITKSTFDLAGIKIIDSNNNIGIVIDEKLMLLKVDFNNNIIDVELNTLVDSNNNEFSFVDEYLSDFIIAKILSSRNDIYQDICKIEYSNRILYNSIRNIRKYKLFEKEKDRQLRLVIDYFHYNNRTLLFESGCISYISYIFENNLLSENAKNSLIDLFYKNKIFYTNRYSFYFKSYNSELLLINNNRISIRKRKNSTAYILSNKTFDSEFKKKDIIKFIQDNDKNNMFITFVDNVTDSLIINFKDMFDRNYIYI